MIKLYYPKFWSSKNLLSSFLLLFSYLYRLLGYIRKAVTRPIRLPGFVICIGNTSVGGTGKTQFAAWLSTQLAKENYNFLIITKGYRSKLKGAKLVEETDTALGVGDESVLLRSYGPVLATTSIKDALPVVYSIKPQVIIFDDGMQNPGFIKDLNIIMIDNERNIGNGRIFPAGPLRQEVSAAIKQADIIINVGRLPCPNLELTHNIEQSLKPCFKAEIQSLNNIDTSEKYYAFTAIGDPSRFFNLLKEKNINLVLSQAYPDHHHYQPQEIASLKKQAKERGARLITTRKDYVKIEDTQDILCIDSALYFVDEKNLIRLINEAIKASSG